MRITRALPAILAFIAGLGCAIAQTLPYKDPSLAVEVRVKDLLARMSLEEKCAQLNLWPNLAELL